ncbi:hypothetical protein P2123_005693, partial [Citrobacter freundii]|nr:hypothetical protein [Citrobacter freundii]
NAWFSFIMDIRKARQFDVYVNDRKAGTFSVDLTNATKALPTLADCTNE